ERGMGFCIFNNVAVLARYLQKRHGIERVAIVDWDVHHGNGTQEAFYEDPTVFYFSIHQFPHYPGSGSESERGAGPGEGFTLNVPLAAGAGDREYLDAFKEKLVPALEEFRPQFVLISAGFDAHRDDPLSGMQVTEKGFRQMTELVAGIANRHASGRIISMLEGGYNLEALPRSVEAHIRALLKD
ncbi:MAG TPA: histone deacetylase, partial [Bacteroidetes bacterium]|nr:histone deacetylase [Bacteroidota bacterium]